MTRLIYEQARSWRDGLSLELEGRGRASGGEVVARDKLLRS